MTDSSHNLSINTKYRMPSGYDIPVLGYGVYQTPATVTEEVVLHALKSGYRHIDSAVGYFNEQPCANAMRKSGLPREEIFFTTKVAPPLKSYEETKKNIEDSLAQTKFDYIDLYLIHAPYGGRDARLGSWKALCEAHAAGKIRSLGVSNYGIQHLEELEAYIKSLPASAPSPPISVGQWELHPWCDRSDIVAWCRQRNIVLQAYCPIVRNQRAGEPVLVELAEKYGKTASQVLIRWSLQMGFVPLPKSENPKRIEENAGVFGWELSEEDMEKLKTGKFEPCAWDPTTSGLDQ